MADKQNIMEEFRIDEISAVDLPAQVGAKMTIMKRNMEKRIALTSMAAGHAHMIVGISGSSGELAELRAGFTSATSTDGHRHSWIMDDAGNIIIADEEGHTHGIGALVTKSDLEAMENVLPKEGTLAGLLDPGQEPAGTADKLGTSEDIMTKQDDKAVEDKAVELEAMKKRAERAEKVAELNDAEKTYMKGLGKEDQDGFLALDADDRGKELAKADEDDSVVFKDNGVEYRKSDDPRLVNLAKQAKAEREKNELLAKAAKDGELQKLAAELQYLPGETKDKIVLLKGIDLLSREDRETALESLRAQNKLMEKHYVSLGTRKAPGAGGDPEDDLDTMAKAINEKDPNLTEAQAMVKAMETPEGQALYAKHIGL